MNNRILEKLNKRCPLCDELAQFKKVIQVDVDHVWFDCICGSTLMLITNTLDEEDKGYLNEQAKNNSKEYSSRA